MTTFFVVCITLLLVSQLFAYIWLFFLHHRQEDLGPKIRVFAESEIGEFKGRMAVLESTWDDVYQKLRRVMGRIDKVGALENNSAAPVAQPTEAEMKAAIMRKARFGAG